jgi:multidrug efflux pump subunit AcrB
MWIVNLALRRPLTFIVLAIFILISGVLCIISTPKDIFPNIDIPVVSVIFNFAGMSPDQVEAHITSPYERVLTTTVEDIQHIESQSLYGIVVIKIFMQPTATLPKAVAQITAVSQTILRQLPIGTTPPLIISYTASNVPVILVGLGGSLSEQELNDLALNVVRIQLITIPGAAIPYPYGGKMKYVSVDLNYQALQAHGLVPSDVVNAISAQNVILPSGTVKSGLYEYQVGLNASPPELSQLNSLPIKTLPNGTTLYVRDVANVHSGNIPQTNIVRFNGARGTMLAVQKTGTASTLDIVKAVKDRLPLLRQLLPDAAEISLLADQSVFVTGAISGVVREGVIAACLTAIMILLFLGDWKSTLIIAISIPLSILASLSLLSAIGQTINIMTLGGLALAVGILVDDATVTIENIDRHLAEGKSVIDGIRDGAAQIAIPAFVSTLCICIVFVPIFFLSGVAKYLFIPLAEAVIFAMLASYILSRTLVPTLAMYWIKGHSEEPKKAERRFFLLSWASAFQRGFENRFERFRESYRDLLSLCLNNGRKVILLVVGFVLASCLLFPFLGQDFFPSVDAGRFDMHVRMKSGTRIEETARTVDEIEQMIRKIIPADQLGEVIDNLGLPYSGINTSYNNTGTVSPADGDILVSLKEGHGPTNDFVRKIRLEMRKQFPDVTVWFPPADIVAQILNFGLSAPMNVQIVGSDRDEIFRFAGKLLGSLGKIPGLVDLRIQEPNDTPRLDITVDRTKASILGLTEQSVASSVLNALSGSQQLTLNYWVDPTNGITYQLNAMVPQYDISSPDALTNLPVLGSTTGQNQILANVASISRSQTSPVMDSFNIRPAINIFAGVDGRDLGAVASDVQKAIDASRKDLPRGSVITLRGQVSTMQDSFFGLYAGLVFSMVLIYLLIVVNFQSWSEPFIIITALPVALVGIIWMLFITETTLSVPALMGAIMCMGVATANSVLVITFANERFEETKDSYLAALEAGYTRIRPVLMTAGAMIIGMFPMALGLGEGGEQNAPLGRAVIGGLIFATGATLFFVPTVFRLLRRHKPSAARMPEAAKS